MPVAYIDRRRISRIKFIGGSNQRSKRCPQRISRHVPFYRRYLGKETYVRGMLYMQMSAIATTGAQKRPWMLRKQTSASAPRDCLYMQQLEPKIGSRCYMGRHLQMQQRRHALPEDAMAVFWGHAVGTAQRVWAARLVLTACCAYCAMALKVVFSGVMWIWIFAWLSQLTRVPTSKGLPSLS